MVKKISKQITEKKVSDSFLLSRYKIDRFLSILFRRIDRNFSWFSIHKACTSSNIQTELS